MQWLTALLAFATTMLLFAIIVSTLVETVHRFVGFRAKGLRVMLESMFEKVIKPRAEAVAKAAAALVPPPPAVALGVTDAKAFADGIMANRAEPSVTSIPILGWLQSLLHRMLEAGKITDIPVEIFMQKLAAKEIIGTVEFSPEEIKDIGQKYEAFGSESSAYFERRARLLSVLLAFFVAWMFYVHPKDLLATYFKDPEVARQVADLHEEGLEAYEALKKSTTTADTSAEDPFDELKKKLDEASKQTEKLAGLGAPVGWPADGAVTRVCRAEGANADPNYAEFCRYTILWREFVYPGASNAFWLLLGGLLIGLGAPFWAQAVSQISATSKVTDKIGEIVGGKPADTKAKTSIRSFSGDVFKGSSVDTGETELLAANTFLRGRVAVAPYPSATEYVAVAAHTLARK